MNRRLAAALLAGILLLTGCWSRREVNDLGPVVGLGVDRTENGKMLLTLSVAQPGAAPGGRTPQGPTGRARVILQREGDTMADALRLTELVSPRRIALDHSQIVVFGERIARDGVDTLLDFLLRSNQVRLSTRMLMVRGSTPQELLQSQPFMRTTQGEALRELESGRAGLTIRLKDFFMARAAVYASPIVPTVHMLPHPSREVGAPPYEVELAGAAVFKAGRVKMFLDRAEGRSMLWLRDNARDAVITAPCPTAADGHFSVRVTRQSRKIRPSWNGRRLAFRVELGGDLLVSDFQCKLDLSKPEHVMQIQRIIQDDIHARISHILRRLQAERLDPVGFGEYVRGRLPAVWREKGGEKWLDTWGEAAVTVVAQVHLVHINMLREPASISE